VVMHFELVTPQKGCSPVGGRIKYGGFAGAKFRFGQFQGGPIVLMKHAQGFSLAIAALSVAVLLAGSATLASADQGDCAQPVSSGPNPVATDCLFILRAAVGLLTCDPLCICDPNASGGNPNATDSLVCLNAAVGVPDLLNCDCGGGTTTTTVGGSTTTTIDGGTTTTVDGGTTTTTDGGSTTTTTIGGGAGACPDTIELIVFAGAGAECTSNGDCEAGTCDAGIGRCATVTSLDTGWQGLSHDADVNERQQAVANLDCGASSAPCGVCDVTGVSADNRACRCANDNQAICDQPFAADADDCGGAICDCYLGPPLPLSAGNTPACVVNRLSEDISGTLNVDTGEGASDVNLRSVVYLGIGVFDPCPYCDGDTTVGDGVRDGTCVGLGANEGAPCDADAVNTSFPWISSSDQGSGTSLDCFPDPGKNVSGAGLRIDLPLSTATQQLTSNVICGFNQVLSELCPCGLCSGDQAITCTANADCAAVGAGNCANAFGGEARQQGCLGDLICNDVGGGEGECNQAPVNYCDAALRANGVPFISCNSNLDCAASPGSGNCTLSEPRECFLPTIVAEGVPDPDYPIGVATFCIAKTSSGGINSVAGLPGPGRVINQGKTVKYCGGLGGDVYVANSG
jgi:hypothetical protein